VTRTEQRTGMLTIGASAALAFGLYKGVGLPILWGWLVGVNIVTALTWWYDKRRAQAGAWRVPESNLILLVLLGGTIAALAASQGLRHKTSKVSFRVGFWIAVLIQIGLLAGWWYVVHHNAPAPLEKIP
jgi:uncharacterized membrane protein YsdA (DUF1294 family)